MSLQVWVDGPQKASVGIGRRLWNATACLPIDLTGTPVHLDLALQVPVGAGGHLLRFELSRVHANMFQGESGLTLSALSPVPQAHSLDATWTVALSPASSLADEALVGATSNVASFSASIWATYRVLEEIFATAHRALEANLTLHAPVAIDTYAGGMKALVKASVAADPSSQRQLAAALYALINKDRSIAPNKSFVEIYQQIFEGYDLLAEKILAQPEMGPFHESLLTMRPGRQKRVKDTFWAFAPTQINLVDTDPTAGVGGTLLLAPAEATTGVSFYQIYLGGAALSSARRIYLGSVTQVTPPMLLNIFPSVFIDQDITHAWAFPSNGEGEFGCGVSALIKNYRLPSE